MHDASWNPHQGAAPDPSAGTSTGNADSRARADASTPVTTPGASHPGPNPGVPSTSVEPNASQVTGAPTAAYPPGGGLVDTTTVQTGGIPVPAPQPTVTHNVEVPLATAGAMSDGDSLPGGPALPGSPGTSGYNTPPNFGLNVYGATGYTNGPTGFAPQALVPSPPRRRFSTAVLALTAALALVLGGVLGTGIGTLIQGDNTAVDTPSQTIDPFFTDPGTNDVEGTEGGFIPVLPNDQEDSDAASTGTRVESAPGVVLINTLLMNGQGAGTGMVIDPSGLVLTNYHVVEGSTTVNVTVGDTGQTYEATVVGHDASRDVALLQLKNATNLETVKINKGTVNEGDAVSAIGNGMGQGYLSEVKGSVTGLNQQITAQSEGSSSGSEELSGLIKTDADVVSGYSGGPLMNADGEVIGVTTAASMGVTSTQVSGYAIPISDAMAIADQIKNGQSSDTVVIGKNAALGVSISTADADSQSSGQQADPSQSNSSGAIIREVFEGSGAEAAGLQAGETITALNGQELSASELSEAIKRYSVGDKVTLTVTGVDGTSREVEVTLGESTVN
ncbi:PDZ domain-containing protein [Actinobaculum sp. 352]|nr:hypothetical protein DDD63_02350 [Actinobaculum sp. 313]RTE50293.1 PDZ domain-containing protein [Actinobaculum sp. 352]